jgi:CheY-like chemotaxis protein
MLSKIGYHVVAKTSPVEALALFREQPDAFDLVMTDMTMPLLTGDLLTKEIMSIRGDIPVILCTGFSERINKERAAEVGIRAFVMKPVVLHDLAETIRNVLDAG